MHVGDELDWLLDAAGQRLRDRHGLPAQGGSAPLAGLLDEMAGAAARQGPLRPWLNLLVRAYCACGGTAHAPDARNNLTTTLAAFAAAMAALDILDDLVDGDPPAGGRQAPNLALALIGESTRLLCDLPAPLGRRLLALWGELWVQCAAAQALDVDCTAQPTLTVEKALAVAIGSGLVTRWAVEAGACLANAPAALLVPLLEFGEHLGTAEKLLHDLHDLWPGAHRSRDLGRLSCTLGLVVAREMGIGRAEAAGEAAFRRRLLESGARHYAWACADDHRLRAAAALERFARAGGDPAPLQASLALSPELQVLELQDAEL